jgi:putative nucleotidyltransferase with HDIG domain
MTPSSGTDGKDSVYPFWGRVKDSSALNRFAWALSPEWRVTIYAAAVASAATCVAASLLVTGYRLGNPWAVAALCLAAVLAQRGRIELGRDVHASISTFPVLLGAVLFGPLAAMPIAVASMLAEPFRPTLRWVSYASSRALTAAAAGLVAFRFAGDGPSELASIVGAACAAALAAQSLDVAFVALVVRLRGLGTPVSLLKTVSPLLLASIPLYAPVVALLVFGYQQVSPWVLPLFLAPALAAQRSFVLYQHERRLTEDLVAVNERLERANLSFATALVATLDARDRYTAGHSAAVAVYARDIAQRMDLSKAECDLAHLCGLVHDIGKIGLPPGLLEKPGALTLEERRMMERHSEIGERILAKVDGYSEIAKIVRHHHERVDGHGYPDGLVGEEIPLISRIIAVADAYNAMTSDRPYRDAMPSRVARMRLAQAVESQFDTTVVAAFEALLAGATDEYRSGIRMDFMFEAQDAESAPLPTVNVA